MAVRRVRREAPPAPRRRSRSPLWVACALALLPGAALFAPAPVAEPQRSPAEPMELADARGSEAMDLFRAWNQAGARSSPDVKRLRVRARAKLAETVALYREALDRYRAPDGSLPPTYAQLEREVETVADSLGLGR